jgi:hypothetical protein
MFSLHAERRMKQRGFHKFDAEIILFLGMPETAPGGSTRYRLSGTMVRELIRSLNRMRNGATAIVGEAGKLQTLYKDFNS